MWNDPEARKRLAKSYEDAKDLVIEPLTREMNLENLSPTKCRLVTGVHLYLDVVNVEACLLDAGEDKAKLAKLLRHAHIYQRLITNLLYETDGAEKIHFQGMRLHAVFYKPYDTTDLKDPPLKRLVAARDFAAQASELAELLAEETGYAFSLEAGIESGDAVATMNGQGGSRELLFIGEPANVAAKQLVGKACVRYGPAAELLAQALPSPPPLPGKWKSWVSEEAENNPVSDFELFEPRERIDFDALGVRTAKVEGASFFADLSGFTGLVGSAKDVDAKRELLRCLHAVRSEMRYVVRTDYAGDHIQYQGDRIQGLFYEAASSSRFASKSVEAAAAMQSVMEVCQEMFPPLAGVGMTVGIDIGRVLVSQLGIRGNRDVVVLGQSAKKAESLQDSSTSGEERVSGALFDELEEDLAKYFKQDQADQSAYVSTATAETISAAQDAKAYKGRVVIQGASGTGARVVPAATGGISPARSWLSKP